MQVLTLEAKYYQNEKAMRNRRPLANASWVESMVQISSGRTGSRSGTRAAGRRHRRRPRSGWADTIRQCDGTWYNTPYGNH
jgi:hypothetical protein